MQLFIISLVLLGVSLAGASPPELTKVKLVRGNCPLFWFSFEDRCYKYVSTLLSWTDAETHCVSQQGNLVSIHSRAEQAFVTSLIESFDHLQGPTWTGLGDSKRDPLMWSDGCPVRFVVWGTGQPDNSAGKNCVGTNYEEERMWHDFPCSETFPSICASRIPVCPH